MWGYDEIRTYECSTHGPIFISSEGAATREPSNNLDKPGHDGDQDSGVPARRKPTPVLNADAVAVPEPDPEPDSN